MSLQVEFHTSLSDIDAREWDSLTDGSPILSHTFLLALEETGCVGDGTGWQPYLMVAKDGGKPVGAIPLYLKSHSYGEYVFDWAWADAHERNDMRYYPKLLAAIPFTPITGPRLLGKDAHIQALMAQAPSRQMEEHAFSSAHVLFPDDASAAILRRLGWLERSGVQFRWENEGFRDFEDFLNVLSHDKRKKIRQERKRIATEGVTCRKITGRDVTREQWDFFYRCYVNTYFEHHSTPYLTREFFYALGDRLPQNTLLILAEQGNRPVAAAFNLFGADCLYGRYWGALHRIPGLHFELCYYQAQEFCIERNIRCFEGGAQGKHKLARGFRPRITRSFHQIAHPGIGAAISRFIANESRSVNAYQSELEERVPYKNS